VVVSHGGVARALMALIGNLNEARAPSADVWQGRVLLFSGNRFDWV
jgi:probable phosphoglycerate mutase